MSGSKRVQSLDILKGLVMVFMALDHVRDYFHASAFLFDPTDPLKTNVPTYLARWITHFCAPTFVLLAGVSIALMRQRKPLNELSSFLWKRGLWLIIVEVLVVDFAWFFDVTFSNILLGVIWAIGMSMVIMALLIKLDRKVLLVIGSIIVVGHNLLDGIQNQSLWFALLHVQNGFPFWGNHVLVTVYPVLPWLGIMILGCWLGGLYNHDVDARYRQSMLLKIGAGAVVSFVVIRYLNNYGNAFNWKRFDTTTQTLMSFFDPLKYPPSLTYTLMTIGPGLIFLSVAERFGDGLNRLLKPLQVFGKVPFFYYIAHLFVLHLGAMLLAEIMGYGWESMILTKWVNWTPALQGYGVTLGYTLLVWLLVLLILYWPCKWYGRYKSNNKHKWWLSYL